MFSVCKVNTTFCVCRKSLFKSLLLLIAILFVSFQGQAQTCASPGKDGIGGTLSGVVNTYYPGVGTASAGTKTISIGSPQGAARTLAKDDLLLVIQMQDANITSSDNSNYGGSTGTGSGATSWGTAGNYEYVAVNTVGAGSVTIIGTGAGGGLLNTYSTAAATGSSGKDSFQVVRVPQYFNATLGSSLTALAWNGSVGGILAVDVSGPLALGNATVNMSAMGFRGGGGRQLNGGKGGSSTDYVTLSTKDYHASKGEGVAGTPRYVYDGNSVVDNVTEGYPGGSYARGAPGNAGGGGSDGNPTTNDENSGGGGGANAGSGGEGGNTWNSNLARGGRGGSVFTPFLTGRVILGGGGGSGTRNNSDTITGASSGGVGGGIVFIRAGTVSGTGRINADGGSGVEPQNDGGGGGGAGGTVVVVAATGGLGSLTISAGGGAGTNADLLPGSSGAAHGPGGGGGGGGVLTSGAATISVSGGLNGTTDGAIAYGATAGTAGSSTTITAASVPGVTYTCGAVPLLVLNKTVSPNGSVAPGSDLAYTVQFTNSGSSLAKTIVISDAIPANTDFKIGTASAAVGTTGLTVITKYSNNGGASFTYTPVSGGGGAPAGYDRLLTNVMWTFTGNLSQASPNNTGSVSFSVRIR